MEIDVGEDFYFQRVALHVAQHLRPDLSAALQDADDRALALRRFDRPNPAAGFLIHPPDLAADDGFVNLYRSHELLEAPDLHHEPDLRTHVVVTRS